MLAPRKKLWSTPTCAINIAAELASLGPDDVLYDVGCGDGRVLIQLASQTPCRTLIGIEIDEQRASEAKENLSKAIEAGHVPSDTTVSIRCENALEVDYSDATVVFLYLVPRGLRLIKNVLLRGRFQEESESTASSTILKNEETIPALLPPLRVITYMIKFVDEEYERKEVCVVDHQQGAEWPIYLYRLGGGAKAKNGNNENCNVQNSSIQCI